MSDPQPEAPAPSSPLARRTAVVSCWLCGIRLHHNQMVPDGGDACLDLRWYCQDIAACTDRWSTAQRHKRAAAAAPSAQMARPSAEDRPGQPGSPLAPGRSAS